MLVTKELLQIADKSISRIDGWKLRPDKLQLDTDHFFNRDRSLRQTPKGGAGRLSRAVFSSQPEASLEDVLYPNISNWGLHKQVGEMQRAPIVPEGHFTDLLLV